MKYKVKFRISANGKKAKYSINIEEGAQFTMSPAGLGVEGGSTQTICLLRVENSQLFAAGENSTRIRLNNREGSEFPVRAGDFVDTGSVAVEFLEVPMPVQQPEEENAATRFLDIGELRKEGVLPAAAAPRVAQVAARIAPQTPQVVAQPKIEEAPPAEEVELDEAEEESEGELTQVRGATAQELRKKASELGVRIQAASKKGKKGKRELRRLKRLQREVEERRLDLEAESEVEAAEAAAVSVPVESAQPRTKSAAPETTATPKSFESKSESRPQVQVAGTAIHKEGANKRRPQAAGHKHKKEEGSETAIARKLFSDNYSSSLSRWNPQPKVLKMIVGGAAAAGIALIIALAVKGHGVKTEQIASGDDPYQAATREPSSGQAVDQPLMVGAPVAANSVAPAPVVPAPVAPAPVAAAPIQDMAPAAAAPVPAVAAAEPVRSEPIAQTVAVAFGRRSTERSHPAPVSYIKDKFFTAIKAGDLKVIKHLVSTRAVDVNFTLEREKTPLMIAASKGHIAVVKYFVSKRANLNAQDSEGTTALMWATHRAQKEIVQFLLKKGANPEIRRDDGDRAIDIAKRWNQYDIVRVLRDAALPNRKVAGQKGHGK